MKTSYLLCLATLLLPTLNHAEQTLSYPEENPLISFTAPDDWKAQVKNGSLFVLSPDGGEVIVEVMAMEAGIDDDAAAVKEAKSTVSADFKKLAFEKSDPAESNGLIVTLLGGSGEDKTGEAHINMALIKHPEAEHQILFSLIASKDSAGTHGPACGAMMNSISAAAAETQTYSYPDKDTPALTMDVPAGWEIDADAKGGYFVSPDKKFTLNVIPIDMEHIDAGLVNITKQVSAKYDEVVWNEGGEPKVNIDESSGATLISSEGVAKGGGIEHKLGVYQFAKKGAEKFFILSAWSPLELADGPNGDAALKMLTSVKLK
jgi:hypothetical protein